MDPEPAGTLSKLPAALEAERLNDEALDESLAGVLAERPAGEAIWLFAYGSLMWNPEVSFDARHVGTLYGYHRNFCLWSRINRGTPQLPGLVLTLERGGSCKGLVYRLKPDSARLELRRLWRRELTLSSYHPRWLGCSGVDGARYHVLAFVSNTRCSGYAGRLPLERMVETLATAAGKFGTSAEYLFRTHETLAAHGIRDTRVERLVRMVKARVAGNA
jgi:glutathione-specific gamma-glutamylcyclotransferase